MLSIQAVLRLSLEEMLSVGSAGCSGPACFNSGKPDRIRAVEPKDEQLVGRGGGAMGLPPGVRSGCVFFLMLA